MNTNISICIPRIETRIQKDFIVNTINKLRIGIVEKIIEIPLRNDINYKRIIMQIRWNNTENSMSIKKRLQNNETVKLVYDNTPWYWKIVATKTNYY